MCISIILRTFLSKSFSMCLCVIYAVFPKSEPGGATNIGKEQFDRIYGVSINVYMHTY